VAELLLCMFVCAAASAQATQHRPCCQHCAQAFLAGCFRYLYVGQFATKAAALAARNAALLAVYGPQVARLHGVSDPDRCSDEEVRAMAAKLRKKAGVAEVMQRHGRLHAAPTGAAAAATTGPAAAAGSRQ
jgi:hypothetical protein